MSYAFPATRKNGHDTHTHTHLLSVILGLMLSASGWAQSTGMAGSHPNTERWIVMLRDRGFLYRQALQAVRAQASLSSRQTALTTLRQLAATDQAGIAQVVTTGGGIVSRHYWCLSAVSVQVPPALVPTLAAMPRVLRMVPVRARPCADAGVALQPQPVGMPTPPIEVSTDALNHNVAAAWTILGNGSGVYQGAGARVAVFDTGIDEDVDGTNSVADPHPSFVDGAGLTPVEAIIRAQAVTTTQHADVNICQVSGPAPYVGLTGQKGFRPNRHDQTAAHGTTMAAIIAGRSYSLTGGPAFAGSGHAPDSWLLDVACASYQGDASVPWVFTDDGYLGGIENLRDYILLNRPVGQRSAYVHVANLSIAGPSSPTHPISMAIDSLARDEDILIVTSAGNFNDFTVASNGFYHGLAVGSVHARSAASLQQSLPANMAFVPMLQTATGPLFGNTKRLYPDLCATGAGPGIAQLAIGGIKRFFRYPNNFDDPIARTTCLVMPGIDILDPSSQTSFPNTGYNVSPVRYNLGTSQAAAQVSGAAALYRGYRASQATPSTAEEARAALLLNVLGTYTSEDGTTASAADKHTYTNRNRCGVGYVRDDLLAEFAIRAPQIQPLATQRSLSELSPTSVVSYAGLTFGARYGVVVCWRRLLNGIDDDGGATEGELPNVDLEITYAGNVIARSESQANSYERVVFMAPGQQGGDPTTVGITIRLNSQIVGSQSVAVQIVARQFAAELDPATQVLDPVHAATGTVATESAGQACTAISSEWQVDSIIPTTYEGAYGSSPFSFVSTTNHYTHRGYEQGFDLNFEYPDHGYSAGSNCHITYDPSVLGPTMLIAGIAFRTWEPFDADNDIAINAWVWSGPNQHPGIWSGPPSGATFVTAVPADLKAHGTAAGELERDRFVVTLPFDTPVSVSGAQPFHIWLSNASTNAFVVDGLRDGAISPYRTQWVWTTALGSGASTREGTAPIIGLIEANSPAAREVRLDAFQEPVSAPGGSLMIDWRLSQMPANSGYVVNFGEWRDTPGLVSSCFAWLNNPVSLPMGTADSNGLAAGTFNLGPGGVHLQFGLQAVVLVSPLVLSNGVRVTVGGAL